MAAEQTHEVTIFAEPLFHIGSFTVTNSLLTSWLAVLTIVILSVVLKSKIKQVPAKMQFLAESLMEGALNLCDQVTNDRKKSLKIMPISLTIFIFVLLNNWFGILPGVGSIGFFEMHDGHEVFIPFLRGGTADLNTTLALGIFSVIASNIFGILAVGLWKTFNKYVNLKALIELPFKIRKDPSLIVVTPISFFVGLIEIVGEIAKVASLSFRLFGNIFAGEVLLVSMSALMAFGLPIPFLFLELVVGIIQALIIAILTTVYFTIASTDHDEHEESHEPAHA
jgi:F-type H+-transporting ATPase subunit a